MRPIVVLLLVAAVAGAAVVAAGAAASRFVSIGPGSVDVEPWADAFERLAPEPGCGETKQDEPCARRYRFRPDATLTAWVSIRNDGPVAVTLHGASGAWLATYADIAPLGKPVAGLDGGRFEHGLDELRPVPFEPVVLEPGDERLIGIEFVTTDAESACRDWVEGGGVVWPAATIAWSWLLAEHEQDVAFPDPIEFTAPTDADCA
jgi:hypothetical protein